MKTKICTKDCALHTGSALTQHYYLLFFFFLQQQKIPWSSQENSWFIAQVTGKFQTEMSSKGKQNFEKEDENTGITVKESQSLNTTSHANDRDESRVSHNKCQQTDSVYKPPESTDVLASGVVFWKDPKFWIQIGIIGVIQLYVFCLFVFTRFYRIYCSKLFFRDWQHYCNG